MGPLVVYEYISANANFFFAFLIGIAFGFVLESSGFSSSRKLAGMFYGYDTVVLKVFFTAAVTGMIGLYFLSLFGWLDYNLIFVNPNYWQSALLGGIIMGVGFIAGGFCPGTSFCAASIGKIDAMVFIGGLFIGIFIFAEAYPLLENFYYSTFLGYPTLDDTLGIKPGLTILIIVLAAFAMFWVGEWAEKKFPRKEY